MLAHQGRDADEDASDEEAKRPCGAGPAAARHDEGRPERQQHQHLGGGRVHVVGEERRAVHDVEQARDHPAPVVPEEGARRESGQRDDDQRDEEPDGGQPAADERLGDGVEGVQQRRPVVDDVHVRRPAAHQLPGAHAARLSVGSSENAPADSVEKPTG